MRPTMLALPLACLVLAACGGGGSTVQNGAQPGDAAVVEGTIDDRMTDIDAAQSDTAMVATENRSERPAGQAARRAVRDAALEGEQNAEAVAAE